MEQIPAADQGKDKKDGAQTGSIQVGKTFQLTRDNKIVAGALLIFFTIVPIFLLIAHWPDKLPEPGQSAEYTDSWFHMNLVEQKQPNADSIKALLSVISDSSLVVTGETDSLILDSLKRTMRTALTQKVDKQDTVNLNTILLILVSLGGFLGSMIYIASSFTNFVGSRTFEPSWTLWYIVKPFTGAGLALIFYFVFRAGFLNFNDASNINLFGIITFATLAGLFTDDATLKLKEVFEVIFKPRDDRPNKLDEEEITITGINPEKIAIDGDNNLIVSGTGLDKKKVFLKINDEVITGAEVKKDSISFSYKVPDALKGAADFKFTIVDEGGKVLFAKVLNK